MKKIIILLLSITLIGCTTYTIQNTNDIKEYMYDDNLAYDAFCEFDGDDKIIRLPNGEYITGTAELDGLYYDSSKDSGAILAKKAEYLNLVYIDAKFQVYETFKDFDDNDLMLNVNGSYIPNGVYYTDENGNVVQATALENNPISIPVSQAKEETLQKYISENKKYKEADGNALSEMLPDNSHISRVCTNEENCFSIHYYGVSQKSYSKYTKKLMTMGFDSVEGFNETSFSAWNKNHIQVTIHYDGSIHRMSITINDYNS